MLRALPALLLATQLVVPLYDWARPWPLASAQLALLQPKLALCVGLASRTVERPEGTIVTEHNRTYLLTSVGRPWPRIVTIEGTTGVSVGVIEWGPIGLLVYALSLLLLLLLLLCALAVWRWWVVVYLRHGREGLRLAT